MRFRRSSPMGTCRTLVVPYSSSPAAGELVAGNAQCDRDSDRPHNSPVEIPPFECLARFHHSTPRPCRFSRRWSHPRRRFSQSIGHTCPPSLRGASRLGVESEAAGESRWGSRGSRRRSPVAPLSPSGQPCDNESYSSPASHHHRHPCHILINPNDTSSVSCVSRPAAQTRHLSRLSPSHRRTSSSSAHANLPSLSPCPYLLSPDPFLCPFCFLPPFSFARASTGLSKLLRSGLLLILAGSATPNPPHMVMPIDPPFYYDLAARSHGTRLTYPRAPLFPAST
ncbi:hypothetical protein EDB84DRAFT_1521503 [Lactarius hengduanensis]|nr:hypothetical protein EDB84DRAFT_1521503 [Lactarius hengduanensis]